MRVYLILVLLLAGACTSRNSAPETELLTQQPAPEAAEEPVTEALPDTLPAPAPAQPEVKKPPRLTFRQLERQFAAPKQRFRITAGRDTVIRGEKGTEIFIPEGALLTRKKHVNIYLQEAYHLPDMLFHNLTTISDGKQLVSNGMINITSEKGVAIDKARPLKVKFPSKGQEPSDLFLGYRDKNGNINWKPQNQVVQPEVSSFTNRSSTYSSVQQGKNFSDAICYQCYDTLQKYIHYPAPLRRKNFKDKVFVDVSVNAIGEATNVKLIQGVHPMIDTMIVSAVKRLKVWRPAFVWNRDEASVVRLSFGVYGSEHGSRIEMPKQHNVAKGNDELYLAWLRRKEEEALQAQQREQQRLAVAREKELFVEAVNTGSARTIRNVDARQVSGYVYSLSDWGWINSDYFWDVPEAEQADLFVQGGPQEEVRIIFGGATRSILDPNFSGRNGLIGFRKISGRKKVTVLGLKMKGDTPLIATKTLNSIPKEPVKLEYREVTYAQLKQLIRQIDSN